MCESVIGTWSHVRMGVWGEGHWPKSEIQPGTLRTYRYQWDKKSLGKAFWLQKLDQVRTVWWGTVWFLPLRGAKSCTWKCVEWGQKNRTVWKWRKLWFHEHVAPLPTLPGLFFFGGVVSLATLFLVSWLFHTVTYICHTFSLAFMILGISSLKLSFLS